MAPLVLYGMYPSPPFRGALLTSKAVGVDVEIRIVNTLNKEHHKEEFLKINPTHTIPVLDDNGYILYDSHAIAGYLVQQYGEDKSLYPTDPKARGLIDQLLHFDSGTFFQNARRIAISILYMGGKEISERDIDNILENYGLVESFLTLGPWIAGKNMTIADLTLGATASTLVSLVPAPVNKFPKLNTWLGKLRSLPYYYLNQKGVDEFHQIIEAKLAENNAQ